MKISEVPKHPTFLVFHDAFDHGAMEIFGYNSFDQACEVANNRNLHLQQSGNDDCGYWKAYQKLPRVRVYAYRGMNRENL